MFRAPQVEGLKSLAKVRSGSFLAFLAFLIVVTVSGSAWALVAVPWYQSVIGNGKVIVYAPMERVQQVDAEIPGRLEEWYVIEGQSVKKGDKLGLLRDIDSKFLDPQQIERTGTMLQAYRSKRELNRMRLTNMELQRKAVMQARSAALPAAQQRIEQNRQRLDQGRQTVVLSKQNLETDLLQLERIGTLEQQGLRSRRDLELIEQSLVKSRTELERNQMALNLSQRDISVAELEYQRQVASFEGELAKINDSYLKAQEELVELEAILAKIEIERSSLQVRRQQQWIVAPRDGKVVRLLQLGTGETVKAGDPLCQILPLAQDPAVELFILDFDAPLVHVGQKVRLMFDGFPAIPFTAFPWAEVGTFGGTVAVVDAVDDGNGRYRLLVVPDTDPAELPWPGPHEGGTPFPLRPGTRAQGWVMMDKPVPLYWELWRRLNAFPPVPRAEDKSFEPKAVLKR